MYREIDASAVEFFQVAYFLIVVISLTASFLIMRREKTTIPAGGVDTSRLSRGKRWIIFMLCIITPVVSQAIFYYGWKNVMLNKAKTANLIGFIAYPFWIVTFGFLRIILFGPGF